MRNAFGFLALCILIFWAFVGSLIVGAISGNWTIAILLGLGCFAVLAYIINLFKAEDDD